MVIHTELTVQSVFVFFFLVVVFSYQLNYQLPSLNAFWYSRTAAAHYFLVFG